MHSIGGESTRLVRGQVLMGILFLIAGMIGYQSDLWAQRPESSFPHAKPG